ncbi:hypothetical protein ACWD0E_28580 [Streptomyces sp. NPDC003002]
MNVRPVPAQPAAAPSSGVPPRHEPRGGPGAGLVVVQAPALEALRAAPERPDGPTASATARRSAPRTPQGSAGGPDEAAPPVQDIPEPPKSAPRGPGRPEGRPHHPRADVEVPRELMRELPVRPADVCALGRRHGHWHPDSPEARICAGVRDG